MSAEAAERRRRKPALKVLAALPIVFEMEPQLSNRPVHTLAGTVLVVDDEAPVRQFVRRTLEYGGFTVMEAQDPHEALQVMDRNPGMVDLVLTDVVMPGMSGRLMADRLMARYPRLRVLFMSGNAEEIQRILNGTKGESNVTLCKPFTPSLLISRVQEALASQHIYSARTTGTTFPGSPRTRSEG